MIPNLILLIFVVLWAMLTAAIGTHTAIRIVELRRTILRGNLDALQILRQIRAGTYRERDWL